MTAGAAHWGMDERPEYCVVPINDSIAGYLQDVVGSSVYALNG